MPGTTAVLVNPMHLVPLTSLSFSLYLTLQLAFVNLYKLMSCKFISSKQ